SPNGLVLQLPAAHEHRLSASGELFLRGIPDVPVALVPNAILGCRSRIDAFLHDHPFDRSVFIMIRYRPRNKALIKSIKRALHSQQLYGVVASEHKLTDDLYNPVACLLCCARGIAVFDQSEVGQNHNPNVAYELGMLHLLNRPCLILKHRQLKSLQSDILMKLYVPYSTPREAVG